MVGRGPTFGEGAVWSAGCCLRQSGRYPAPPCRRRGKVWVCARRSETPRWACSADRAGCGLCPIDQVS